MKCMKGINCVVGTIEKVDERICVGPERPDVVIVREVVLASGRAVVVMI